MPSFSHPSRAAIKPHPCPKCRGPMLLTHIKPSRIGFERRTFQGLNCDHVDRLVAECDSMKWIASGLQAPS
jgi:hypothetical protein